jgi:DNA-binding MarR family transcriptional regulator
MAQPKSQEVADLSLALGLLVRRMRSEAPTETRELSWTQRSVIARLASDGPATTADLARAEGVKPQSMGTAIAGLETAGIVARTPHPTDGRQVTIALTPHGVALRKRSRDARETWLAQAIVTLDRDDQATLFAATGVLKRLAQK